MTALEVMRAKVNAAGILQSPSQITVVRQSSSTIVINPANPNVVYVPSTTRWWSMARRMLCTPIRLR